MYINIHTYICVCIYKSSGTKVHSTRQKEKERKKEGEKESEREREGDNIYMCIYIYIHTCIHIHKHLVCHIRCVTFGVSFNPNRQFQAHESLFNGTWEKRPRERDLRLRFKK